MTANVITYRGRSAVRDVRKALGYEEEEIARLTSQINTFEWRDPKDTLERRFRDQGFNLGDPRTLRFFSLTREILELPRHLGNTRGCCGIRTIARALASSRWICWGWG